MKKLVLIVMACVISVPALAQNDDWLYQMENRQRQLELERQQQDMQRQIEQQQRQQELQMQQMQDQLRMERARNQRQDSDPFGLHQKPGQLEGW